MPRGVRLVCRQVETLPLDVTSYAMNSPSRTRLTPNRARRHGRRRQSPADMVMEFHRAFNLSEGVTPQLPDPALTDLRYSLIEEELCELREAIDSRDLVAVADALGDIVYVTYGAAVSFGIKLDVVLAEIHRSNMSKLGLDGRALLDERGKVVKGPNYSPPNLFPILNSQSSL